MNMNKQRIMVRSFMSIRTYALLAAFAAILLILLFSAGCSGGAAKSSLGGPAEYSFGDTRISVDGRTAHQDVDKHEIRIGI